jgi:hypothetical protein
VLETDGDLPVELILPVHIHYYDFLTLKLGLSYGMEAWHVQYAFCFFPFKFALVSFLPMFLSAPFLVAYSGLPVKVQRLAVERWKFAVANIFLDVLLS